MKFSLLLLASTALALMPRQKAPSFKATAVVDEKFQQVSLDDYADKWRVLVFFPADFTFVCPTELIGYSSLVPEFTKLNAHVIGISTDSQHSHLAWIRTKRSEGGLGKIGYPLVADVSKEISKAYGVLVQNPDDSMDGLALRGLFIIDPKGMVRHMQINDDQAGRNVEETVRLIQAFQFADEHGEVCPASWQPGGATIKPDQEKKSDYFRAANAGSEL